MGTELIDLSGWELTGAVCIEGMACDGRLRDIVYFRRSHDIIAEDEQSTTALMSER
jgi:hypothetical protein